MFEWTPSTEKLTLILVDPMDLPPFIEVPDGYWGPRRPLGRRPPVDTRTDIAFDLRLHGTPRLRRSRDSRGRDQSPLTL